MLGGRVGGRRGVEHVDAAVQVGVVDQLVQVLEPVGSGGPRVSFRGTARQLQQLTQAGEKTEW